MGEAFAVKRTGGWPGISGILRTGPAASRSWFAGGMRISRLAPAGVALLALAGCSSTSTSPSSHTSAHGSAASPTTRAVGHASATGSVSPSAPPTHVPTVSTDVSACTTGHCEVRVSASTKITFKPGLDIDTLRVVAVDAGSGIVTIDTTSSSNSNGGGAYGSGGTCSTSGTNGDVTDKMSVDCAVTNNSLSMSIVSIDGSSAVLKLAPAS